MADYVVFRGSLRDVARTRNARSRTHILVIVPFSRGTFDRGAWARAISVAKADASLDLGMRPTSARLASATTFNAIVRSTRGAKRTASNEDTSAPAVPSALTVTQVAQSSLSFTWAPSSEVDVVGYGVYRDGSLVASVATPSHTFAGLRCGTSHEIAVDAVDAAGNRSTRIRRIASTSTCAGGGSGSGTGPDTVAPSAPLGLARTASSQVSITIGWSASSDNTGVAGYGVYRNGTLVGSTVLTTSTVPGLACGTTYTLAVDAYDVAGNRSQRTTLSSSTSACAGAGDTAAPSVPTGLARTSATATSVSVGWSASSDNVGVAGYGVYRSGVLQASVAGTSTTLSGLACSTSYAIEVDAFDAAGNRSGRAAVSAATGACPSDTTPPSVPQGLRTASATGTQIVIAWNASSDNVGVSVYRLFRDGTLAGTTSSLTYAFTGLTCGTAYALAVEAVDAAGNASYRPEAVLSTGTSACGGGSPPPPPPPPPPVPPVSGLANLWVDTSGGSCVRSSAAGAYVDAAACGSFDAAYDRAAPGDVIEIIGGNYSGQALNGDKGSTTPIYVRTAAGQTVTINGYMDIAADYVHLSGPMTVSRGVDVDDSNQGNPINGVVVSNVKADSSFIENTYDLLIKDSEFGPNPGAILIQIGGLPESQRLTLDNVYLHDNPPTSADQHLECIFSTGIQGLTIRNSRTQNCGYFGLLSGMCCSAPREPSNFVFENNTFGQTKCYPNAGGCPASGNAPVSMMLSRPVSGTSRIVGNHFVTPPAYTGSFANLTAFGNTGAAPAAWR